jgi:hypothetical protein
MAVREVMKLLETERKRIREENSELRMQVQFFVGDGTVANGIAKNCL